MSKPHAEFPLGPFTPHDANPILRPQGDGWESSSVYNPAAVVKDDKVVLLDRGRADDIISHVGLATSDDGIHFDRHPEPVLSPTEDYERFGCEDPRVTEIDGTYYLTYTAWEKHGPLFPDFNTFEPNAQDTPTPWSKAGAILDRQVNGRWLMYFGEGSIYHAWSDDLIHWEPAPQDEPLMLPTPKGTFREFLVEVGPQPIVTSSGLILLLHNAAVKFEDGTVRYTCGQLLFHPDRPTEIMAQMNYPWLEPTSFEDQHGLVSNVTFIEGLVHLKGTWFAYYGQSDSTLGVATYKVGETYGGLL